MDINIVGDTSTLTLTIYETGGDHFAVYLDGLLLPHCVCGERTDAGIQTLTIGDRFDGFAFDKEHEFRIIAICRSDMRYGITCWDEKTGAVIYFDYSFPLA